MGARLQSPFGAFSEPRTHGFDWTGAICGVDEVGQAPGRGSRSSLGCSTRQILMPGGGSGCPCCGTTPYGLGKSGSLHFEQPRKLKSVLPWRATPGKERFGPP